MYLIAIYYFDVDPHGLEINLNIVIMLLYSYIFDIPSFLHAYEWLIAFLNEHHVSFLDVHNKD